jgi:hypothetical protein
MTIYDAMQIAYPPGITYTCRECGGERRNGEPHVCGKPDQPRAKSGLFYLTESQWGTIKVSLERNRNFLADAFEKGDVDERHYKWAVEQVESALLAINPEGI